MLWSPTALLSILLPRSEKARSNAATAHSLHYCKSKLKISKYCRSRLCIHGAVGNRRCYLRLCILVHPPAWRLHAPALTPPNSPDVQPRLVLPQLPLCGFAGAVPKSPATGRPAGGGLALGRAPSWRRICIVILVSTLVRRIVLGLRLPACGFACFGAVPRHWPGVFGSAQPIGRRCDRAARGARSPR